MKRALPGILVLLAVTGFALWWFSPRQMLLRRTRALLDTITVEAGAGRAARGLQAAGIDGFLAPRIRLDVPDGEAAGTWSRDDVSAGFRHVAVRADSTRFELESVASLEIDGATAVIEGRIEAEVRIDGRPRLGGLYPVEFTWTKGEDRWRIAAVRMGEPAR